MVTKSDVEERLHDGRETFLESW